MAEGIVTGGVKKSWFKATVGDVGEAAVRGGGSFIAKHPKAIYRGLKWGAVGAAIIGAYGLGSSEGRRRERSNRPIQGPLQY